MYLIIGRSCTGKDTLADIMVKAGHKKVISRTTRKPRFDGEDTHIFVTREQAKKEEPKLCQTEINGELYYVLEEDLKDKDVYIIDVEGMYQLIKTMPKEDFTILYLTAGIDERLDRFGNRLGCKDIFDSNNLEIMQEAFQRFCSEDDQFSSFEQQEWTLDLSISTSPLLIISENARVFNIFTGNHIVNVRSTDLSEDYFVKDNKKSSKSKNVNSQNRLAKISEYGNNLRAEETARQDKLVEEYNSMVLEIHNLEPRISALIETANACIRNEIAINADIDKHHYEDNDFLADGISHKVGFWWFPCRKGTPLNYVGCQGGGWAGDWQVKTNGSVIKFEKESGNFGKVSLQNKHYALNKFIEESKEFEETFYKYVDSHLD